MQTLKPSQLSKLQKEAEATDQTAGEGGGLATEGVDEDSDWEDDEDDADFVEASDMDDEDDD